MKFLLFLILIILASLSRLIPHPANFTPLIAIALFSGSSIKNKWVAASVPALALLFSNLILGFEGISLIVLILISCLALFGRNIKHSRSMWFQKSILCSLIFYFISNFYVWIQGSLYQVNLEGLIECYWMALPFFKNTLLSTIFYSAALFESDFFFKKHINGLKKINQVIS